MIAIVARFHPFPLEIEGILPPASYLLGCIYFLGVCHSQWVEKKSHMNLTCAFSIRLQFWNFCKLNCVFPTFLCLLLNTFADMGGLNTWVFEIFLSLCILDVNPSERGADTFPVLKAASPLYPGCADCLPAAPCEAVWPAILSCWQPSGMMLLPACVHQNGIYKIHSDYVRSACHSGWIYFFP